jgi:hypothetical protein
MSTPQQRASRKQEGRITRSFKEIQESAHQTPGSGNQWRAKSDVVTELFQIEAKTKMKPSTSITLKKEWFTKIGLEAFEVGKLGIVAFSFGDQKDYLAIESREFIALMEELLEYRKRGNND